MLLKLKKLSKVSYNFKRCPVSRFALSRDGTVPSRDGNVKNSLRCIFPQILIEYPLYPAHNILSLSVWYQISWPAQFVVIIALEDQCEGIPFGAWSAL